MRNPAIMEAAAGSAAVTDATSLESDGGALSRTFRGTPDQIRAVRRFVSGALSGHAAADSAILIASELATNSIRHSASGQHGGTFAVHLSRINEQQVAVLITEQRGSGNPVIQKASSDTESGRGLAVVMALADEFRIMDSGIIRRSLAVISAR